MTQEIELKLWLLPSGASEVPKVIERMGAHYQGQYPVLNQYLDTADLKLHQNACALRIRKKGDRWIQTLKAAGTSASGLHQRQEWEWPLASNELDINVLHPLCEHLGLASDIWSCVRPQFTTDFLRDEWLLKRDGAEIEMVLDRGKVCTENKAQGESEGCNKQAVETLSELELELRSGKTKTLWQLADDLSQNLPVLPSSLSKAERGYRLGAPKQWLSLAFERRQQPCQHLADTIFALECLRFEPSIAQACFDWLRTYPNDRLQQLLGKLASGGLQDPEAVQTLGHKLIVELRKEAQS